MTALAACHSAPTTTASTGGGEMASTPSGTLSPQDELKQQVGDRIFFAFDKSDISSDAQAILSRQADFTKKYPDLKFTIEGHCDERGTREYNLALGERRATADKNALVALGVDAGRLKTISYGKERPAVDGHNEAAWAQNRRAVTVIDQ
jgi:peptidoglycan-associated lipoprotein